MQRTIYKIIPAILALFVFSTKTYSQCNTTNVAGSLPQWSAFGSVTSDTLEPWRAFDGDSTTHWGSNGGGANQEIGIDFGQQFNFCSIYMKWGVNAYPTGFFIQGSNDYATWTTLKEVYGNTQSTFTVTDLPLTGTYSLLRIITLGRPEGSATYDLYTMRVYSRIANTLPQVTLTAPARGMSFLLGNSIDVTANASDADGTVSKVEFYRDATKLATDSVAPYSYTWTNADTGRYAIYAKAIDNLGGYKISDTATIRVSNAPATLRSWNLTGSTIYNSNPGYVSIGKIPGHLPADTSIKLTVNGYIYAKKLTITQTVWADYVFKPAYRLRPLKEVEAFIQKHQHLPDVPTTAQVEKNGVSIGDNQALLLKKIEELTLYMIQQGKQQEAQQKTITEQNKALARMQEEIEKLKTLNSKK